MNAARLGRMLTEAGDDRTRWPEAIYDKVTDPASGLVTRDHLDRRFAEFEVRFGQFETRFGQFESRFAQIETRYAQIETPFAKLETKLTRTVIFSQVGGFIALAVLILFKMR